MRGLEFVRQRRSEPFWNRQFRERFFNLLEGRNADSAEMRHGGSLSVEFGRSAPYVEEERQRVPRFPTAPVGFGQDGNYEALRLETLGFYVLGMIYSDRAFYFQDF